MIKYIILGANKRGIAFTNILLKLSNETILLIDEKQDPIHLNILNELKEYTNFLHMFGINVESTLKSVPYDTFVDAQYIGCPKPFFHKNCIYLQNIFIDQEEESARILAKLEAIGVPVEIYALADDWSKYVVHYMNLYNLKLLDISDILFPTN